MRRAGVLVLLAAKWLHVVEGEGRDARTLQHNSSSSALRSTSRPKTVSLRTFYGRARHDVYANLSLRPRDLRGWGVDRRLYRKLVSVMTPAVIVEVGVWKGATTIPLAKELKALGAGGVVIAVDTWLGAVEFWTRLMGGERDLQFVNGYPSVYYTFLSNVVHEQVQDVVVPLPSPSLMAAQILTVKHIRPVLLSSSNPGPIARPSSPHSVPSSGHYGPTGDEHVTEAVVGSRGMLASGDCAPRRISRVHGREDGLARVVATGDGRRNYVRGRLHGVLARPLSGRR